MTGGLRDGSVVRAWVRGAGLALDAACARIDAVNVFPVADADTGTNTLLTWRGGLEQVGSVAPGTDGPTVLAALARGSLLAARGSSGVILSRYLAGLAAATAAGDDLPAALTSAAVAAREAVHDPQDGTVLTLAATVAAAAAGRSAASGAVVLDEAGALAAGLSAGHTELARISAEHPVLRSARVLDSGACALLVVLDALAAALDGSTAAPDLGWLPEAAAATDGTGRPGSTGADAGAGGPASGTDAVEVMAVLRAGAAAGDLRAALAMVGDAVAVVDGTDTSGTAVQHAHVHTVDPAPAVAVLRAGGAAAVRVQGVDGGPSGTVAITASAEVAVPLARTGAVVLVLTAGPTTAAEDAAALLDRAVDDAGRAGGPVVVLPGGLGELCGLGQEDDGGPGATRWGRDVQVLDPATDDLRVLVAAQVLGRPAPSAHDPVADDRPGEHLAADGPSVVDRAGHVLAGLRPVEITDLSALADELGRLRAATPAAEHVTLLLGPGGDPGRTETVARRAAPALGLTVAGPVAHGPLVRLVVHPVSGTEAADGAAAVVRTPTPAPATPAPTPIASPSPAPTSPGPLATSPCPPTPREDA
ncbi:MAG TPA: DAK2 domain-containing protein [Cellulomonas sp.]